MGKYSCGHRAAVLSMFTFSRPKHCGEEEKGKKTLLDVKPGAGGRNAFLQS